MKSLMTLWRELAEESAGWCGTSALRDIKTVMERVEKEGDSFLTITLPQFEKDFVRSLEIGKVGSDLFLGFKKRSGLPVFLRGFLIQIFDTSGTLLDTPSIDCIRAVRQLTAGFGKIERQCSDARISRAMRRYVEIEEELKAIDSSSFEEYLPLYLKASTLLWADVFSDVENSITGGHQLALDWLTHEESHNLQKKAQSKHGREEDGFLSLLRIGFNFDHKPIEKVVDKPIVEPLSQLTLLPRHGPGATADRLRGNAKFDNVVWPQRLERVFPYGDYALPNARYEYELDRVQFLEPGKETPVKVVAVPKTLKNPRIIAEEPTAMQYMQQALSQQFVARLEDYSPSRSESPEVSRAQKACDLGKWFIGFTSQEPNRLLACEGSLNGRLATLDLSEASDRVLNQHVELLMSRFPRLSEAVQATRSLKADVPGQGVIPLVKFASMGSALCFPVEAMVFVTIIFSAIAYERNVPLTRGLIMSLRGKVRVYGDDIVVPVEYVQRVIQFLEAFGLLVNKDKSFWNGKFRESCGGDYYDGEWVTPIRLRQDLPQSLADVQGIVALAAYRNLLYWGGYWRTAEKLDRRLSTLLKGNWTIVDQTASGIGRESVLPYQAERIHPDTHVPLVRGAAVSHRIPKSPISGVGALMKFFISRGKTPMQDKEHLERSGRPEVARIKLRWIRPY